MSSWVDSVEISVHVIGCEIDTGSSVLVDCVVLYVNRVSAIV